MGILTDFYVADSSELDGAFGWLRSEQTGAPPEFDPDDPDGSTDAINAWVEEQPCPEPSDTEHARMAALERLEYKGVLSGCVSTLRHLLLGTEIDVAGDCIMSAAGHVLEKVPDDLIQAVATCSDTKLLDLAPAWATHEEVRWTEDHAREFLPLFANLTRIALDRKKGVYLLISGF